MSRAADRLMDGVGEVQGSILATCIKGQLEARAFPDDARIEDVFSLSVKSALHENWMEPPAPAQLVLGSAVAATFEWLKGKSRDQDADDVMFEAKVLFRMMNDPSTLFEVIREREPEDIRPAGLRAIWMDVCKAEGFNENTARPL